MFYHGVVGAWLGKIYLMIGMCIGKADFDIYIKAEKYLIFKIT